MTFSLQCIFGTPKFYRRLMTGAIIWPRDHEYQLMSSSRHAPNQVSQWVTLTGVGYSTGSPSKLSPVIINGPPPNLRMCIEIRTFLLVPASTIGRTALSRVVCPLFRFLLSEMAIGDHKTGTIKLILWRGSTQDAIAFCSM